MAWSEPPFIVVSLIFLLVLCRVWERRAVNGLDLVSLAVLCWLGFLLRYVGVSLIIVGAVTLLLALRPLDRRAVGRIVAFGALAVSVPIVWMLRNHAADGTYLGPRSPSPDSLWDVAERTAAVIGQWIVPWPDMSTGALALVGLAAVALISIALARIEWPREGPCRGRTDVLLHLHPDLRRVADGLIAHDRDQSDKLEVFVADLRAIGRGRVRRRGTSDTSAATVPCGATCSLVSCRSA